MPWIGDGEHLTIALRGSHDAAVTVMEYENTIVLFLTTPDGTLPPGGFGELRFDMADNDVVAGLEAFGPPVREVTLNPDAADARPEVTIHFDPHNHFNYITLYDQSEQPMSLSDFAGMPFEVTFADGTVSSGMAEGDAADQDPATPPEDEVDGPITPDDPIAPNEPQAPDNPQTPDEPQTPDDPETDWLIPSEVRVGFETLATGPVDQQVPGLTITGQRSGDTDDSPSDTGIVDTETTGWDNSGNALALQALSGPGISPSGGTISVDFENISTVLSLDLLDVDEPGGTIDLFDIDGALLGTVAIPQGEPDGVQMLDIGVEGVASMDITLVGAGAIDNLCYVPVSTREDHRAVQLYQSLMADDTGEDIPDETDDPDQETLAEAV